MPTDPTATAGRVQSPTPPATAAGLEAAHSVLCRCRDCLADDYGYTPSIEPDPSLVEDGAA